MKKILVGVVLVVSFLPGKGQDSQEKNTNKPNVLFIAIDDLRPELGCYGYDYIHSPNIDRLALEGLVFNRAYCQQALCSPSRSSMLTGLRPDATHIYALETHFRETVPNVVTLPQHFKNNGYFTTWWGKIYHAWFLDSLSWSEEGTNQERRLEPQWPQENWRAYALEKSKKLAENNDSYGPIIEKAPLPDNAYPDGKVAEHAVRTLRELKEKQQPFFLAVGFYKPHIPWTAPAKYWQHYPLEKVHLPGNHAAPQDVSEYGLNEWEHYRKYTDVEDDAPLSASNTRELRQAYYACISYVDAQVGKVLDELDKLGLADNTIVVLWGDHGFKLGEYGAWSKTTNFELDTRVPLIISTPWLTHKGEKTESLAELIDVYPTLCDLAGIPKPKHLQGSSLQTALQEPKNNMQSIAFSQYPENSEEIMGYSLRSDRYRLTVWVSFDAQKKVLDVDLFDHLSDPGENYNLAYELSTEKFKNIAEEVLFTADYRYNGIDRDKDIVRKLMLWKKETL